jgi:hypothetical protein
VKTPHPSFTLYIFLDLPSSIAKMMESTIYASDVAKLSLSPGNCLNAPQLRIEEIRSPITSLGFLNLPREIRDEIYGLLFLAEGRIVYPSKSRAGSISEAINLLRTNKQIYSEAVEILYGQNMFQIRGDPAFKAPELLALLIFRKRKEERTNTLSDLCLARNHLRKLSIPSHGISLNQLKHLFSLLKYFPRLEHVQVIFLGRRGSNDMDIVNLCRLLRDRLPLVRTFVLGKRINYSQAEDISWMVSERPYRKWTTVVDDVDPPVPLSVKLPPLPKDGHVWINEVGETRQTKLMDAAQKIPE